MIWDVDIICIGRVILQEFIFTVYSRKWLKSVCYCDLFISVLLDLMSKSSSFIVYSLPGVHFIDLIVSFFLAVPFYKFISITVVHSRACTRI
jgi:hypothetical protein